MFCNNCGERINNNSAFCGVCGERVNNKNQLANINYANSSRKMYTKNRKRNPIAKIVAILVLLLCVGGVYGYNNYISVNSSREKVSREFLMSLRDADYDRFLKTIYISSEEYKDNANVKKNFLKETRGFRSKVVGELGEGWENKLIYIERQGDNKVEVLCDGKSIIDIPTVKIKNKYYIDTSLEDLI